MTTAMTTLHGVQVMTQVLPKLLRFQVGSTEASHFKQAAKVCMEWDRKIKRRTITQQQTIQKATKNRNFASNVDRVC